MTNFDEISDGGSIADGNGYTKIVNPVYIRDLIVGDRVYYFQKHKMCAAIVVEVTEDSGDLFYLLRQVRLPGWQSGDSQTFLVHESKVLPVDENESYHLLDKFLN